MSLQEIRQQAYNELDKLGYTKLFDNRPKDAIPPVWEDLWFLYQKVRERLPQTIVEFGSGCSTIIMTKAIADNQRNCWGTLISSESNLFWKTVLQRGFPEISVVNKTQIHFAPCIEQQWDNVSCFYYHNEIFNFMWDEIDFLYLDGPELTDKTKVTLNPVVLEPRFADNFYMVVDGRPETVNFLEKHLKGKYDIQRNYVENRTTFEKIA